MSSKYERRKKLKQQKARKKQLQDVGIQLAVTIAGSVISGLILRWLN
jgi:hypothetical protein